MKHRLLILLIVSLPLTSIGQFNDTIIYKTGYEKAVAIDSFDNSMVYYKYYNKTIDETKEGQINIRQLKRFVVYDEEGIKIYDSNIDYTGEKVVEKVDSLKIAEHDLSVNPFMIALLSPSVRYTYKFGNHMEWGINTRLTYINPLIFKDLTSTGILMVGAGIRFMPYYSRKLGFGLDFTPMFLFTEGEYGVLLPIGLDFDFYFGNRFGIALDFGAGYAFSNGYVGFAGRGNIGFLMRLGKRYNVPNASNSVK